MKLILMTLITIGASAIIVWALIKLVEKIYNIQVLRHSDHNHDVTKQKQGIVYNKNGKDGERLEADQSTITPF
jgi:hypothetical protein